MSVHRHAMGSASRWMANPMVERIGNLLAGARVRSHGELKGRHI